MPVSHLPRRGSVVIARIASDLSRLEIDARIDQRVKDVAQEIGEKTEEPEDVEGGEQHRVVAIDCRAPAEKTEAIEGADGLDQQRAGEEGADKGTGQAG